MLVLASVPSVVNSIGARLLSAPAAIKTDPCYVAFTAVVTDSITARIERIITSGVRRLEAVPVSTTTCVPLDSDRVKSIERAVRRLVARTAETGPSNSSKSDTPDPTSFRIISRASPATPHAIRTGCTPTLTITRA